jgi:D-glycero-alpha-D-manno-heptose-7-phosphate kinase
MIISKCPLRVSLVGGSTDLQEFIDAYNWGSVISFPINLYTYITINPNIRSKKYRIDYSSPEEVENPKDIKNDIAREVIQYFNLPPLIMSFNSDIPSSGSGLASSSSYLLACISAACKFKGIDMSQGDICKLAIKLERKFNPLTGYQDAYGCGIGSLKQYNFYSHKIETEYLSSSVLDDYSLYLVPSNVSSRSSTNILKTVDIKKSFRLLALVRELKSNLNNEDAFFKVFNLGWEKKKMTSSHIMTPELIEQEKYLLKTYNIKGIKLCGAGGGGYFLLITKDKIKEGKQIKINNLGVQVWEI